MATEPKGIWKKLDKIVANEAVVMSDAELDWLGQEGLLPLDVASIRNPYQVGLLDAYIVGKLDCPAISEYRAKYGLAA